MRRFATGVTIVTTTLDGEHFGFTANAFSSVSAEPPMVLVCVKRDAHSHGLISRAERFGVSILGSDQIEIARRFASPSREGRFEGVKTHTAATGAPLIADALAYVDCTVAEEHTAGTHTIFLGSVRACGSRVGRALGYFNAQYADFGVEIT